MKANSINRRNFLIKGTQACIGACAIMAFNNTYANAGSMNLMKDEEPIDPKTLNYCGYKCPADCKFLKASLENNAELKKEAYDLWKIKEHYGVEFDAEKIFCFGCKAKDQLVGIVIQKCTVRSCAIEKGYDCCIECNGLETCKNELWSNFPDFKKVVVDMQKKYFAEKT
jgi:hypothetical protein